MKKVAFKCVFKVICIIMCLVLTSCGNIASITSEKDYTNSEDVDSTDNQFEDIVTVDICDYRLKDYLKADTVQEQFNYLTTYTKTDLMHQTLNLTSWNSDGSREYTFVFSENSDYSDSFSLQSFSTSLSDAKILIPGHHYYWKVYGQDRNKELDSGKIYVNDDVVARPITLDGVGNTRDVGGWYTEYGGSIKYGMMYRGMALDNITEQGKETLKTLRVKSELDIRSPSNNPSAVEGVNLIRYYVDTRLQYDQVFEDYNKEKLQKSYQSIFEILSNKDNYPIYLHCQHGADRTGTLIFFLNGLLGVSYEDLTRDFEMTSFTRTPGKRWRGTGLSGTFLDSDLEQIAPPNYIAWGKLYKRTMEEFGDNNLRLSQAIEKFLLDYVEIPKEHIEEFKKIMTSEN